MLSSHSPELKAVCLDMDGTLVDSERLWDVAVEELSTQMGRPLDRETRERTLGVSIDGFFDILGEYTGNPVQGLFREQLATQLNDRVTELMRTDLTWRPGAKLLLDSLQEADIPLALVTNTTSEVAAIPIAFIGATRFRVIITGDAVPQTKPAPDPYLVACEKLGANPKTVLAVEDSVTGASSAVSAGCQVLYIPSTLGQPAVPGAHQHDTLVGVSAKNLLALTTSIPESPIVGESRK